LLKALVALRFDQISLHGREYRFPAKAGIDYDALMEKGAKSGGEFAAKETIKYFIPGMGTLFFLMDCKKAIDYVQSDKDVTLAPGTKVIVESTGKATLPLR